MRWPYLDGDTASCAVVMHEDAQHVRDELGQVELELAPQGDHDLLDQQDDGVLHGVVGRPVLLRITRVRRTCQENVSGERVGKLHYVVKAHKP